MPGPPASRPLSQYAFEPDFEKLLALLPAALPLETVQQVQALRVDGPLFGEPPPDRDDVEKQDRTVPGRDGDPDVAIRIYRPKASTEAPRPGVFEIHGGGFMIGSIAMMDPRCQIVAAELAAVVVSLE